MAKIKFVEKNVDTTKNTDTEEMEELTFPRGMENWFHKNLGKI